MLLKPSVIAFRRIQASIAETDGNSFSIRAPGADQSFDTEDDIVVGPFSKAQEAIDLWEEHDVEFDFEGLEDFESDDLDDDIEVE